MWKFPYTCLLILLISFASFVMCIVYRRRLRKVARAIRIARELYDTMLQTVQSCKLVVDDALERPDDTARMRLALEKLSTWLGQATQEGQQALNSISSSLHAAPKARNMIARGKR